uniref:protein-lysine methyltransferase METTL21C-like n=1 Tax=Myxine glutinosa TaxID=7769 RepID=UPI00358E739F
MAYGRFPTERFYLVGKEIVITESLNDIGEAGMVSSLGIQLARFLHWHQDELALTGRTVLELGAGTGLVSITACLMGAKVIATDRGPVLGSLNHNVLHNTGCAQVSYPIEVRPFEWGVHDAEFHGVHVDVVLASDVVYRQLHAQLLLKTLPELIRGETKLFLCIKPRWNFVLEFLLDLGRELDLRLRVLEGADGVRVYEGMQKGCASWLSENFMEDEDGANDDNTNESCQEDDN